MELYKLQIQLPIRRLDHNDLCPSITKSCDTVQQLALHHHFPQYRESEINEKCFSGREIIHDYTYMVYVSDLHASNVAAVTTGRQSRL